MQDNDDYYFFFGGGVYRCGFLKFYLYDCCCVFFYFVTQTARSQTNILTIVLHVCEQNVLF